MSQHYSYLANLIDTLSVIPPDSIISRTVHDDEQTKVILFGFAAGQELSEHTAARPAVLHFIEGEARLELDGDMMEANPGTWVHMKPHLPHSVYAETKVIMLLILLPGEKNV